MEGNVVQTSFPAKISESWVGTIQMHTTNCSIGIRFEALEAEQGIYSWEADVFNCQVFPDLAVTTDERAAARTGLPQTFRAIPQSTEFFDGKEHGDDFNTRIDGTAIRRDQIGSQSTTDKLIFNAAQHEVRDIVHPSMCFRDYTFGKPQWSDLPAMTQTFLTASCAAEVPSWCHEKASCALKFPEANFRDAKDPDPYFDPFITDCLNRTDQGVTDFLFPDIVHDWDMSLLVIKQGGLENILLRDGVRVPDGTNNCSAWNVTAECVCDRGYVGNGRCCEDRQVLFRNKNGLHVSIL